MNVLLTSAGRRSYLVSYFKEALRKADCGGLVHAANSQISPAFAYADKTVVTPLIYDKNYIPFLLEYCRREKIGLLIPLFDIDIPVLAAHREEFAASGTIVVTADKPEADICNDKWETFRVLSEAGINMPATWLDEREAAQAADSRTADAGASDDKAAGGEAFGRTAGWPLVVKPRWGMGSLSIFTADNEEELRILVQKSRRGIRNSYLKYESLQDSDRCVLIQEMLKGQEYGLDIINDLEGRFRAVSVKRKDAMRSGETDGAETVENEELARLGQKLSGLIRHRGNLDADVFEAGGKYYVLELNARFGGGYPFSHAAGVDLPLALVLWALGREVPDELLRAKPGVRAQKDIRMLVWQQNMNKDRI
ncbi:MAG: ATP-grasp domain-containing protein [Enterocloster sp.]